MDCAAVHVSSTLSTLHEPQQLGVGQVHVDVLGVGWEWDSLECGGMGLAGTWDWTGACLFCPTCMSTPGLSHHCGELVRDVVGQGHEV